MIATAAPSGRNTLWGLPIGSLPPTRCSPAMWGSPVVWAARYPTMNGRRRLVGSFNHGTMACALPHAIGAQTAFHDRQVIALAGDGGLTMLFGELVTLIQNRLPVKVIIFNNSSLNFVELEMRATGIVNFGTDLVNPSFAAVAQAMGVFGRRVEAPGDLEQALVDAFTYDGPAVVDVITARQELSIPPAITVDQAKGFRCTRSGPSSPGGPTSCSTWSPRTSRGASWIDPPRTFSDFQAAARAALPGLPGIVRENDFH